MSVRVVWMPGSAETIHIVEGVFAIEVGGQSSRLMPGDTVHVPAELVHSGGDVGEKPLELIQSWKAEGASRDAQDPRDLATDADA